MRIDAPWLSEPSLQAVFAAFEAAGHRVWLVGGAVRNAVLDEPVEDLDLATDATPDQMAQLAAVVGIKAVPTGAEHGTMTLIAQGVPHEVTTFRRDVETFGRRATVAFTREMAEDARRRDFTMNALYADAGGQVIDPLGGLADALARRVRFVGDAGQRIAEDYLRILRFFRFHAQYGGAGGMDAEGLAAIAQHLDGLYGLARERIGSEMRRLLAAPDPAPAVGAMAQVGALGRILPGADTRALAPLVHLEHEAGAAPDAMRRLAALGGDDVRDRLRLSNSDSARLDLLRGEIGAITDASTLGYRHGANAARDILLLRAAMLEMPLDNAALKAAHVGAGAVFPVTAKDLMPRYEGAALGARLKTLEARWIASGFALTRQDLLDEAP
ncbi:CCA tRNA nucleotidyltransferase [Pelagivirga sediminicola]|uniref:CCA tRNA nucleotidyltransferase n=1 Tax=Pelagivirga sediminicola TaxID=2170575 RepID=A0A2T7G8K8_9RHOB|nr:CCA tRNA nucleotidyltransferase [Pelagivirga sediminicola]PVA10749.1 CCA tRNA nucleotidyltransferase [Pelagivirga sediminicola]